MKSIIKYSAVFIMFVITLLVTMDINSTSQRKAEANDSLSISERTVLKAVSINDMYEMTESDMKTELVRNVAQNINTDSEIDIVVYDVDTAGLVDAAIISQYQHMNGVIDSRRTRKTMIVEEWDK